jgi:transposase
MIGKAVEVSILRVHHAEKWPVGTIAKELQVHHTTVQRVLCQAGVEASVVAPRKSKTDPYLPFIQEQLQKYPTLCASRLFQMVKERGYCGGPDHFRRVVGRVRPKKVKEAFQRLRTLAGEQAQVDWAYFGKLKVGRAVRPLWAFVMVLSYSRQVFLQFYPGASMPFFLCGHGEAFQFFGGVPRVLLYDNLKSVVTARHGDAIQFHPTVLELSAHYRFEPRPVAVARGNEKGRVERTIRYVRDSFFAGREFSGLAELNCQAGLWTTQLSAQRPWAEDKTRTVSEVFDEERLVLLPLPVAPFPTDEQTVVKIGKTPYARFDLNDYSIPHDFTQQSLMVVADQQTVRLLHGTQLLATHPRSWDRGQQIEDPAHLARLTAEKSRAREHRGLDRLTKSVRSGREFLREVGNRHGNLGRTVQQLLELLDTHSATDLQAALIGALEHNTVHIGAVRQILDQIRSNRGLPPPVTMVMATHVANRDVVVTPHPLATYDSLTKEDSK